MQLIRYQKTLLLVLSGFVSVEFMQAGRTAHWLIYNHDNFHFDFKTDHKGDTIYLKNGEYFSGNQLDQLFYARSIWDFTASARFGDAIKGKLGLRSRVLWGSTQSIDAEDNTISIIDITQPDHTHYVNRLIPWIKRAWIKFSFNEAFDINSEQKHYFKIGMFPFELGRGIALGSGYALDAELLGFFTDSTIDQYASGVLIHGDISTRLGLTYDAYAGLLKNCSMSLTQNTEPIYSHEVNHPTIYRGPGAITYVIAGRFFWSLFDNNTAGRLTAEPYGLFYRGPCTTNEFFADGDARLGTLGFAVEYNGPHWEWGFDTAVNCGNQRARAWDRNYIKIQHNETTAAIEVANNAVYDGGTKAAGAPYALQTDTNKQTIEQGGYGAAFNNQQIGSSSLYNGPFRFKRQFFTQLDGYMFVTDAVYWIKPKTLKIAATVAYASGDEHPSVALLDPQQTEVNGTYAGFIGLQELYMGKRVRSLFILGPWVSARPLTAPDSSLDTLQRYASGIDGFANVVYTGTGLTWRPDGYKRTVTLNPNILYYWQACAVKKYCLTCQGSQTSSTLPENASTALGLEMNVLGEVRWLDNLNGYVALGVFVPGAHYTDVIGKPVDAEQVAEIYRPTRYGIECNEYPLLNNKTAFLMNIGFEYEF